MTLILSGTDGLSDVDGSAATPAIRGTDANTGIFFPAADTIAFSEGGAEAMRIDSSGRVGIGTSSPAAKLDVRGSSSFLINATNPTAWVSVDSALTTGAMYNQWNTTSNVGITGTYTNHAHTFVTNNTERMRIDSSGNVGIGTSSPSNAISVSRSTGEAVISITNAGSASSWLTLAPSSSGNAYIHNTSNVATIFTTNGSERMRIDSSGNVGVNNTNPTQYATSGKVLNLTGTATNSGPANLYLSGSSATLGRGFNSTEIFAIASITSASEITRITGSGANGYRAYFKIIVTGHTSGVSNAINIKEYYWDGATNAPVQISTYTQGTGTPVISFDNSTTQVCIIKLASSNGTSGFNGVMKVEWMIPVDFASNTWTIS